MNTTLLVICAVVALYLGACVHQWRRLGRHEVKPADRSGPPSQGL